jgi:Protein of unknown function (DUF4058)
MAYPFPGMNPYLEQPAFWSSLHSRLIVAIADTVAPQILPNYYIEVETRTYSEDPSNELLIGIPDAVILTQPSMARSLPTTATAVQTRPQQVQLPIGLEVKDRYLEVRETETNAVVTVIELLSPKNKRAGKGRSAYEAKRDRILESMAHLVEIDLLRIADPMPLQNDLSWDYRILVSRSEARPNADLYGFTLRERIPDFPLPLKQPEEFVSIDLQSILQGVYDRAGYDYRIDYQQAVPPPTLSAEDKIWVSKILASTTIAP